MKQPSRKTVRILLIVALCYSTGKLLLPYITPRKPLYGALKSDVISDLVVNHFESSIILSSAGDGLVQEAIDFEASSNLPEISFNRSLTLQVPKQGALREISYQDLSVTKSGAAAERIEVPVTTKAMGKSFEVEPNDAKAFSFIKGHNQYQLTYTIKNALVSETNRRLFIWNVLSRHFIVETRTLSGSIAFPRGIKRELVEIRSLAYGMNEAQRTQRIDNFLAGQGDNFLIFDRTQPLSEGGNDYITFHAPRPLVPGELVLISADWPTAAESSQQQGTSSEAQVEPVEE